MPIRAKCGGCGAVVGAPEAAAGKKVKCPKCAELILVPAATSDFEVVDDDEPPPVKAKPVVAKAIPAKPAKAPAEFEVVEDADDDEPPAKKPKAKPKKRVVEEEEDDDDDADDRPRKKGKKAGGPPWLLIRLGILLLVGTLLIGGVYLWKFGGKDSGGDSGNGNNNPAGGGNNNAGPKFVELNDPAGGFSVLVPTQATKDTGMPGLQGSSWKSVTADGRTTVKVGSYTLPPGIFPMDRAVDAGAALAQMDPRLLDGKGYTKVKQEPKQIGGKMGVMVVLEPKNEPGKLPKQHIVIGIAFDEKGKLFGIEITSAEAADAQLVNTVFNSFRIL
jgi:DNA-directed RNA polymerase subunit RPC12/RpoP